VANHAHLALSNDLSFDVFGVVPFELDFGDGVNMSHHDVEGVEGAIRGGSGRRADMRS